MANNIKGKFVCAYNEIAKSTVVQKCCDIYKRYTFAIDILAILLYKLIYDVVYLWCISPMYKYSGFVTDLEVIKYMLSILTVIIFAFPMVRLYRQKTPSAIIVLLMSLMYFIPVVSMYGLADWDTQFFIAAICYWAFLLFCQFKMPTLYLKKIPNQKINRLVMTVSIIIISGVVIYVSGAYTGFRVTFELLDVYTTRAEASTYNIPTVVNYLLSFAGIAVPVFFLYSVQEKKWMLCALLCIVFILNYSIGSHKSEFMIYALAVVGYVFYRERLIKLFPWALSALGVVSMGVQTILGNTIITSLFYRRVISVPALLSYRYYEFSADNYLNIFRNGILDNFGFHKVYDYSMAYIVGEFHDDRLYAANNGLLGDGFINIGFLSVLIMPVIIAVALKALDSVCKKINPRVYVVICVYYAMSFANGSWSTVLLTHGFLFICFLMYFFPTQKTTEVYYEG